MDETEDIFKGLGVKIFLPDEGSFLKVRETLQRIGVASRKDKILYQSCHILHKQGQYAIMHFKNMFQMDGKPTDFTEEDKARLHKIVELLIDWELVTLADPEYKLDPMAPMSSIKVLSFKEKKDWITETKYTIGKGVK